MKVTLPAGLRSSWLVLLIALQSGCQEADSSKQAGKALIRDPITTKIYHNSDFGFRLEVPDQPWVVRWRRFRDDSPPRKLKGTLRLVLQGHIAVSLDVWLRPGREPVRQWFETVLRETVSREAVRTEIRATRHGVATLQFTEPRSPQAPARRLAIFALGPRVYRLTCHDAERPAFRQAFDRALASFGEASP